MITYTFEPIADTVILRVWLCGAIVYETVRVPPDHCENHATCYDTEASRATLLEAAQPTIDALREYFKE